MFLSYLRKIFTCLKFLRPDEESNYYFETAKKKLWKELDIVSIIKQNRIQRALMKMLLPTQQRLLLRMQATGNVLPELGAKEVRWWGFRDTHQNDSSDVASDGFANYLMSLQG